MIESLWPDRRGIESVVVPSLRRGAALAAASLPLFRALKQSMNGLWGQRTPAVNHPHTGSESP